MDTTKLIKPIRWIIVLLTPFFLALLIVRLLISWDYPAWEYPRIAPDAYGWTDAERLEMARTTLDYLQHPDPAHETIYILKDMRLPNSNQPVYIASEIKHMLDVKYVADNFRVALWVVGLVWLAGLIFLLAQSSIRVDGAKALKQGGLFTVGLLILIMLFIGLGWSIAFKLFHDIFFDAGTWTFYYTDSLIRLFPEQFWFDFGLLWTGAILLCGAVLALIGWLLEKQIRAI